MALAGLVWNPPTSCAWAARVYVNSRLARDHGIKSVGLPSRLASFCTGEPSSAGPGPSGRGARLRLSWWGSQAQPKGYRAPRPSDAEVRGGSSPKSPDSDDRSRSSGVRCLPLT